MEPLTFSCKSNNKTIRCMDKCVCMCAAKPGKNVCTQFIYISTQ